MGLSDYFRVGASVLRAADYVLILKIAELPPSCVSREIPNTSLATESMAKLAFRNKRTIRVREVILL